MREETAAQTSARLLEVIARADVEILPGLYAFVALDGGPGAARKDGLACVRDGDVWSQLVPVEDSGAPMGFRVFSFHFDPALDATGFVGWLHSHLGRATGVGHIVVCGRSARGATDHVRGGIFDYWGCPAADAERVLAEVHGLVERGRRPRRAHVGLAGGCMLCEAMGGADPDYPVIAESPRAVGILIGRDARSRGQSLFFPRRHAPNLHDLDDAETSEIFALLRRVAVALRLEQYNVLQNNGASAGQTVFHAHVHLVPKPSSAAGLVVEGGLIPADQIGMAEEIRRRVGP